ncbi:MAG: hypothetical protein L0Y73_05350 [Candidatus Aminicenantes bacterium]|nr:hypothetical protein [Candidatus Aminicenantes bacterium]
MKKSWAGVIFLGLSFVLALMPVPDAASVAAVQAAPEPVLETGLKDAVIEDLAADFRALRRIKGHFAGGDWNDEADKWLGRKHRIMIEIGSRLADGKHRESAIIALLGQPDHITRPHDELFELIDKHPGYGSFAHGNHKFLVYYWRGRHDFLYFTCRENVVVNSGWRYAWE